MTTYINCNIHAINLIRGTEFPPSGDVARVSEIYTELGGCPCPATANCEGCDTTMTSGWCNGECQDYTEYSSLPGLITGLPDPVDGVKYIVSAMVLTAAKAAGRTDCVAPATGHPSCRRNDKGQIIAVPGFVV